MESIIITWSKKGLKPSFLRKLLTGIGPVTSALPKRKSAFGQVGQA